MVDFSNCFKIPEAEIEGDMGEFDMGKPQGGRPLVNIISIM
ncbi:hypothetical protein CLERM_455 [Coxiella-like endosymbiont]|nr:hypothetical protein [Coxiella endosymbiont of Rhipicephalus microplus]PMB54710.1 hypothetical protein CLERM_455 [Coxiella-like endosymbiont]